MAATVKSSARVFGGILQRMTHQSAVCKCEMTFAVYLPAQSEAAAVHSLYWLSGLTCTDENFAQKAGGFRAAAARGLALVMPDTSPRGVTIEGADDAYDFGSGAGFYVDATEAKWKDHYQMYSYVTKELPAVLAATFPAQLSGKASISGHSMGGHGALTLFLKNPGMYASASAFAPICSPTRCPWGTKAFEGYLGSVEAGRAHDTVELINGLSSGDGLELLVDQGSTDNFLTGDVDQLQPTRLAEACAAKGISLNLRMQEGYDHSFFFISTFIDDHVNFHADALAK